MSTSNLPEEVTPIAAFDALTADPGSLLLDVRTFAEWSYVGLPQAPRPVLTVEWQSFPTGTRNPNFVAEVQAALEAVGGGAASTLYVICRSGARSRAATSVLNAAGMRAVNVAEGFEGDLDPATARRGIFNGWKQAGLPWRQS